MLSYQHGYHAGNFADVHKHLLFSLVLDYLVQKPAPMTVLDVYAGRGRYNLGSAEALKTGEAEQGILKLWPPVGVELADHARQQGWPEAVQPYVDALHKFSPVLEYYPGSPCLAQHWLRETDEHILSELHPHEHEQLMRAMKAKAAKKGAKAHIHKRDAMEALLALTPPKARRGVVLVDPSYEVKSDYLTVARTVREALSRWPEASWLIWYPLLGKRMHGPLLDQLKGRGKRGHLVSELMVREPGIGMQGSGMLVINPPWGLADKLEQSRHWLGLLGEEGSAKLMLKVETAL